MHFCHILQEHRDRGLSLNDCLAIHRLLQTCWVPILSLTYCEWLYIMSYSAIPTSILDNQFEEKKQAIWMLSSKADQHDWFVVLILKSQCCLTIVDKVKQHEPPSSHDDSHCDTLSWLVTLVTSHASLCFDATLNNSQSFNKLQRVSAKPTVSLDRDTVPEHADMFLLSCIIRAQGAWTIYRLPPPHHLTPGGSSLCTLCGYTLLHYAMV